MSFSDKVTIRIRSGDGGDGHVSFRREKYVANGGPDGGDGGKGGDLIFEVDPGLNTLSDFRYQQKFFASNGEPGGKRRCHGADGDDLVVKVPPGTIVREAETGQVITDMSYENTREILLKGGRGGKGNMNFATPTMQAPKYAQPGKPGIELTVILELKVIADVGLVGFPNVGKSTLLSRVSAAKPKIANYHFTTLNPNLGVVDLEGGRGFVMADIPGLIEGAAEGVGLGHDFLRHIERTRVILHVVDAASTEGRDPIEDIRAINRELSEYDAVLAERPQIIAANKLDCLYGEDRETVLTLLKEEFEPQGIPVYPISAVTGEGVKELLYQVRKMLDDTPQEPVVYEREYEVKLPDFSDEPYTVSVSEEEENTYLVEGPRIERMLGYTNLDSEKGFAFFQKFIVENGIQDELKKLGIQEGDTVKIYGWEFEYYP
ncbi:MAG: GTPase ObgE [Eubacterium sp.]|nr:GTPase ObgE [Eubacterium sp.]